MAKLDKKARYDEFSMVGDKFCIGGSEIFHIWKSTNGWVWYATQVNTIKKIPNTFYGYVEGNFNEWGSWYASDMLSGDIQEIPKSHWGIVSEHKLQIPQ